jgi:hypothetical protein
LTHLHACRKRRLGPGGNIEYRGEDVGILLDQDRDRLGLGYGTVDAIGTTAPFSAMSGVEKNVMSLLCTALLPPSALTTSSTEWVSNADLFQACACAALGLQPTRSREQRQHACSRCPSSTSACVWGSFFENAPHQKGNCNMPPGRRLEVVDDTSVCRRRTTDVAATPTPCGQNAPQTANVTTLTLARWR